MAIGDFVKLRRVVWVATLLGLALTAVAQEPPREAGPFRQPELVEMPSEYDEMTERSHISYRGGSEAARHLRDMLRTAMEAEGFAVYEPEWWALRLQGLAEVSDIEHRLLRDSQTSYQDAESLIANAERKGG
jgi:hypothetical protein